MWQHRRTPEASWRVAGNTLNRAKGKPARKAYRAQQEEILRESGIPFTIVNKGICVIFREEGKPKVDFFLSTGRWRVVAGETELYEGGAEGFLEWYSTQGVS